MIETSDRPEKIDHVWIDLHAGAAGLLRLSLSTCSRQSLAAGVDPRVWMAVVTSPREVLPTAGVELSSPLDYAKIEEAPPSAFAPYERETLEQLLIVKARRARWAEAWGELYLRGHVGLHQIHSRRASLAVPTDHIGEDGALRFYYDTGDPCELLLFKFAGQP